MILMKTLKLSIIIPAYNEEKNLRRGVLDKIENYLKNAPYRYEVIIVDDGSKDKTVKIVQQQILNKKNFKLIIGAHAGKAVAVMRGLLSSTGDIALFTDMDQATPIKEIEKFFPRFSEGHDIVIGSRSGREGAPIVRKLAAWGFSLLRNILLGLPFEDTQCGFKAFNRKSINEIFPILLKKWQKKKVSGGAVNAGFDVEILFIAKKKNFKIAQVPVEWNYVDTERVQVIKDAYEAIIDMFKIKINDLKGSYSTS